MDDHESYMADFMRIFEGVERWGPGSDADTLRALEALPTRPTRVLDIGCGKGVATFVLTENSDATITAVDNEQTAIDALNAAAAARGCADRVRGVCASMTDLPFESASFDLIWAEGSAYIMGVEKALLQWKHLLSGASMIAVSDLVWLSDAPAQQAREFWANEYPDMQHLAVRRSQIRAVGYDIVQDFTLSQESWSGYIEPLRARIAELEPEMEGSAARQDLETELGLYDRFLGTDFGYQFFVLQRV